MADAEMSDTNTRRRKLMDLDRTGEQLAMFATRSEGNPNLFRFDDLSR